MGLRSSCTSGPRGKIELQRGPVDLVQSRRAALALKGHKVRVARG